MATKNLYLTIKILKKLLRFKPIICHLIIDLSLNAMINIHRKFLEILINFNVIFVDSSKVRVFKLVILD